MTIHWKDRTPAAKTLTAIVTQIADVRHHQEIRMLLEDPDPMTSVHKRDRPVTITRSRVAVFLLQGQGIDGRYIYTFDRIETL